MNCLKTVLYWLALYTCVGAGAGGYVLPLLHSLLFRPLDNSLLSYVGMLVGITGGATLGLLVGIRKAML
jgi:hypothetical protein